MSDINIVIGAKNEASKILGDVTKDVRVAGDNISRMGKESKAAGDMMQISFAGMAKAGAILGTAFAAIKGAGALGGFFASAISDFNEAEESVRKLTTAINLSGADASKSIDGHVALSEAMERQLNIEAEVTQGLMAQASMMGIADNQIDSVTKTAIGLSEAMGVSLEDGLKKARLATEGNFESFSKLIPSLKDMATDEERLAAVIALSEKGLVQKSQAAGSAAQADERATLALGRFSETVGSALAPMQELVFNGLGIVIESLNSAFGPSIASAGEYFSSFSSMITSGAKWLATQIIAAVTLIEVGWNNLGLVFKTIGTSMKLSLETLRADIGAILNYDVELVKWFAENWLSILKDLANNGAQLLANYIKVVSGNFKILWEFIRSGFEGGVSGVMSKISSNITENLTKDFEFTTKAIPAMAERAMTETEKALTRDLNQSTGTIMEEFQRKFDERIGMVNRDMETNPLSTTVDLKIDKKKIEADVKAAKPAVDVKTSTVNVDKQTLQASESRLLTRGDVTQAPMETVAESSKETLSQVQNIASQMASFSPFLQAVVPGIGAMTGYLANISKKEPLRAEGVS